MKTSFHLKRLFVIAFTLYLFQMVAFGETSPFTLKVNPLKERIPAGDLIPVAVTFTIAPNHRVYKDQVKVESADPSRFTVTSTERPAGKVGCDPFLG